MNVAVYARISTADQNASMQEDELRAYCKRRGLTVVGGIRTRLAGRRLPSRLTAAPSRRPRPKVRHDHGLEDRSLREVAPPPRQRPSRSRGRRRGVYFAPGQPGFHHAERKAPVPRFSGGSGIRTVSYQRARSSGDESWDEAGQTVRSTANPGRSRKDSRFAVGGASWSDCRESLGYPANGMSARSCQARISRRVDSSAVFVVFYLR